jgi:general stress protein 26
LYENVQSGQLTKEQIDAYLDQPLLARMATASAATVQPHVVPVWYLWDGQSIWVHGHSSTRKFKELAANPACSIIVDHATSGVDFWAVLLEGQAELITDPAVVVLVAERIYVRYIGAEGLLDPVPQSWIHDAESLLLKLTPSRTVTWYSASKPVQEA